MTITGLPKLVAKPFGGANSIHDKDQKEFLDECLQNFHTSLNVQKLKHEFFDTYKTWLPQYHNLNGFDFYKEACYTNGSTESFDNFHLRYKAEKRLRLAKGEYFHHQMTQKLYIKKNFAWLHEEELREGDYLVISSPFSDTGDVYNNLEDILTDCDRKQIPVMLDLAYINLAENLNINLDHDCIEYIVSSLSKPFPLENYRIGIRLQKRMFEDPLYVINEDNYNYLNVIGLYLGTKFMSTYPANYLTQKYKNSQAKWCSTLNLEKSPCVIFGIDNNNNFPEYNRGLQTNRLCFSKIWDGRVQYDQTT